ncbi:uncharacterized protein [Dermacentor andersoni]|uniref:uncharacterized protein isoform X2 n=1 Tax=Dermacentor andersoni TaxID=34620 RepID=UPI0024172D79|nr:uncharacterized protein LOC126537396 isoform X2 [Dermacentor andersoni]
MFTAAASFRARWAGRGLARVVRRDHAVDAGSFAAYLRLRRPALHYLLGRRYRCTPAPPLNMNAPLVRPGARSAPLDRAIALWATSGRGHFVKVDNLASGAADYVANHSGPLHPVLGKLCQETQKQRFRVMMSDTAELQLINIFLKASGARNYLEIGVFTGVSALAAALALPPDGRVTGLEIDAETVNVGRPFWKEAGVDGKIDIIIGDAKKSLGPVARASVRPNHQRPRDGGHPAAEPQASDRRSRRDQLRHRGRRRYVRPQEMNAAADNAQRQP